VIGQVMRPENHQCGFVDVTGRAYPEFVAAVSQATKLMYPARVSGETSRVKILETLISKPAETESKKTTDKAANSTQHSTIPESGRIRGGASDKE